MEKNYCFAGLELSVCTRDEWMYEDDRVLAPFRVDSVTDPHRFAFDFVDSLTPPSGTLLATMDNFVEYRQEDAFIRYIGAVNGDWTVAYIRACHKGKDHTVQMKRDTYPAGLGPKAVLNAIQAEHLIARNHGFVFHCSYIDREGKAILFTAPSETGKSTQADLWHQYRNAEIINGDRAAVRLVDGVLMAEGIPFAGSSVYCKNRSLPVEAIVYLAQAPQTTIRRLRGVEAFRRIWEGVSVNTWDKEDMSAVMDTVTRLTEQVPVYYMPCTPDETAVEALEQALRKVDDQ